MKFFRLIFPLVILSVLYFGCKPAPVFPATPSLKFKRFIEKPGNDTLWVVYSFTDGDGDIGISPTDKDTNFVMTLYYRTPAGVWHVQDDINTPNPNDSTYYPFRIPPLTAGQRGLEGDIYAYVNKTLLMGLHDTVMFKSFLLDQAHHKSDYISTRDTILIP